MARKLRMYLPGIPAHVVQRGNNRAVCFFCDDDYLFYLELLRQGLRRFCVRLHAYVLMTNHVHLLMTPEKEDSISRLMQHVGRNYVLYIKRAIAAPARCGRVGTRPAWSMPITTCLPASRWTRLTPI